jgi:transposase InsO family protein
MALPQTSCSHGAACGARQPDSSQQWRRGRTGVGLPSFARDIGLEPRTTPIESPQSNGMIEAFVRAIKRNYVRVSLRPDAETVMLQLSSCLTHYNEVHSNKDSRISFTP